MGAAWMCWSSGKDSLTALDRARGRDGIDVTGLLTTFNRSHDRVAMHAVRREVVEEQAEALGLPLHTVELPDPCPNEEYERAMAGAIERARRDGVDAMIFGDLYLEDVREYREQMLEGTGIEPCFPLWGEPTPALARSMVERGTRAIVTCVDPTRLDPAFAGRTFDQRFLDDLPDDVDPCGEHGEFHTFAYEGPGLSRPLSVRAGEIVERSGFVFCDVLPNATNGRDGPARR